MKVSRRNAQTQAPMGNEHPEQTVEISGKGKWTSIPALHVNGYALVVRPEGWLKLAVVHDEEWRAGEIEEPEACIERLKAHRGRAMRADLFTFSQKLPATAPKYSYPMEWDSIAAVHVTSFKQWWDELPQESRKNVRRSQKRGVVVEVRELDDELVRGIVEVNNDSPIRQNIPFVHHGKTHDQVRKDQSSFVDRSDFICAYLGGELIGFLKLVYGKDTASLLQILPKASRYDARPANAMLAKAVEVCGKKGISYLIYGKYTYGNQGSTSLKEFKTRNGFKEFLVPTYYVPLTLRGRIAMTMHLHRGLAAMLPSGVVRIGVNMRARWYNRKLSPGRCSSTVEQPKL